MLLRKGWPSTLFPCGLSWTPCLPISAHGGGSRACAPCEYHGVYLKRPSRRLPLMFQGTEIDTPQSKLDIVHTETRFTPRNRRGRNEMETDSFYTTRKTCLRHGRHLACTQMTSFYGIYGWNNSTPTLFAHSLHSYTLWIQNSWWNKTILGETIPYPFW